MPFDVLLSRATSFDELDRVEPTLLSRLPAPPRARKLPDGTYWLDHQDGGPWIAVAQQGKSIVLSSSYSSPRFLRNFADSFDLALTLAGALKVRVFETTGGREVTPANVDALLHPDGEYVGLEAETWKNVRRRMGEENLAPLEFPVGPIDLVSEYFGFSLRRDRPIRGEDVEAALGRAFGARVSRADPSGDSFLVRGRDTRGFFARTFGGGAPPNVCKVLARPEGTVAVWPGWTESFADVAPTVLDVVEALSKELGATATHGGSTVDAPYLRELRARENGLGVDVYLWRRDAG